MARTTRKRVPKGLRFDILKRDNFTCRYCGRAAPEVKIHVDHIVAVANGGTNKSDNLVTSCETCNVGKGAKVMPPEPKPAPEQPIMHCVACRGPQPHVVTNEGAACVPCYRSGRRRAGDDAGFIVETWYGRICEDFGGAPELSSKSVIKLLGVLSRADLLDAIEIVHDRMQEFGIATCEADRYFYGVCWNMVRQRRGDDA